MRPLVFLLLLIVSFSAYAQQGAQSVDEKKADALLNKVNQNQATGDERKELHKMAIIIQNNGQELDEKYRQYKKSLVAIDKAIILFTALNDTLDIANNRKYKGYLLGRLEKFAAAKNETKIAIDLYQAKKMSAGVAVSQFDIARIYEFENKMDSAIYYAEQSRIFWKEKEVDARLLITNNMLVNLFVKTNQLEKAKIIQQESVLLISKPQLHWQGVLDFYYLSMLLYKTINDVSVAGDYQRLYLTKVADLNNAGIAARSYYENDR